jgi:hypothetical protein
MAALKCYSFSFQPKYYPAVVLAWTPFQYAALLYVFVLIESIAIEWHVGILLGREWHYQVWYRSVHQPHDGHEFAISHWQWVNLTTHPQPGHASCECKCRWRMYSQFAVRSHHHLMIILF